MKSSPDPLPDPNSRGAGARHSPVDRAYAKSAAETPIGDAVKAMLAGLGERAERDQRQRQLLFDFVTRAIDDPALSPLLVEHIAFHAAECVSVTPPDVERWVRHSLSHARNSPRQAFLGIAKAEFGKRNLPWPFGQKRTA